MKEHDVAIIGGGIVGAATAYYLAKSAIRSIIFEQDGIASKASGLSYGGIVAVSGFEVPSVMWELGQYASELHSELRDCLTGESNIDCKYRDRDTLNVAFTNEELHVLKDRSVWINEETNVQSDLLESRTALEIEPRLNPKILGASLLHGTQEVDSKSLTEALVQASGCDVLTKKVISLSPKENTVDIALEDNSVCSAYRVVCANGTWVEPLLKTMGTTVSVPPLKGEILRLKTQGPPLNQSIGWNGNYCTTKTDDLTWAGTTESKSGYDTSTTTSGKETILKNLKFVVPGLTIEHVVRQTACLRPTTIDGLPIIGSLPTHPNVLVGTGAGRKGILYGPAIGKIIADSIAVAKTEINFDPFLARRLFDNV